MDKNERIREVTNSSSLDFLCRYSTDEENPSELSSISNTLHDFSYEIDSCHGLVYFVTNYELIEQLIKSLVHLISLRLYVIGCLNTRMNATRLETNLLKSLPRLKQFHFFFKLMGEKNFSRWIPSDIFHGILLPIRIYPPICISYLLYPSNSLVLINVSMSISSIQLEPLFQVIHSKTIENMTRSFI